MAWVLSEGLEKGLTLGKNSKKYQKCLEALITLRFGLDLPESLYEKLLQRLHKRVTESLERKPSSKKAKKTK